MTEDEQRRFGINKNLLKTKVPTHYGKGEHKVKLAYITEPEAKILKELDLYGSNPPHEGPGGIPNYNDSGGTADGVGKTGGFGGKDKGKERDKRSLKDRIADRKKAGTFKATTPTADFKPDFDEQDYLKSQFLTNGDGNFVTNNGQRIKTPGAFENYLDGQGIGGQEEEGFQGFPALFSGIANTVGDFMNSPLGNTIGMAANPLGYTLGQIGKNIYGAYNDEDEDTGIMSALSNAFQQSTPFGEMSASIGNPFSGVPNAAELNTTTNIGDTFTMPEQSFVNSLFTDQNYGLSPEAKQGITTTPVGVAQQTYGDPTGAASYNFGVQGDPQLSMEQLGSLANQDFDNQTPGFFDNVRTDYNNTKDFFGNLFSGLDIQPNDLEAERRANRGPGDGPLIPLLGMYEGGRVGYNEGGMTEQEYMEAESRRQRERTFNQEFEDFQRRMESPSIEDEVLMSMENGPFGINGTLSDEFSDINYQRQLDPNLSISASASRSGEDEIQKRINATLQQEILQDLLLSINLSKGESQDSQSNINLNYSPTDNTNLNANYSPEQDQAFLNATYNFNQGGAVNRAALPPDRGPMFNGIGNLFKTK
jgi:hypothetical protein